MGQLSVMFFAGILTPTLCCVLIFILFLLCWFKCNLRERVNEFLDGRKTERKPQTEGTIVANAHFKNYKSRKDNDSLSSETDSAIDSLHDISMDEFSGSRSGSNSGSRGSPSIKQTQIQQQHAGIGPVVDLLWEVNETREAPSYSDYTHVKTLRTISCETIDNNLDRKRMSKIPSKDLISSLATCPPSNGAYSLQSPTDNTIVGLPVSDNYEDSRTVSLYNTDSQSHRQYDHRHSAGEYQRDYQSHRGPPQYLAAMSMDFTEI